MTADNPSAADNPARSLAQREITRIALSGIGPAGFVLVGSGAIREHGLISRPTEDVDLFTVAEAADRFPAAVDRLITDLRGAGYTVQVIRRSGTFAVSTSATRRSRWRSISVSTGAATIR